jgi:hypothetical protein
MNSDLMPSSESSNSSAHYQSQNHKEAAANVHAVAVQSSQGESPPLTLGKTTRMEI